ncbi:hypothetical protein ACS0TY_036920 [Phlomoides rotata]
MLLVFEATYTPFPSTANYSKLSRKDHERGFVKDYEGCPMMTATDDSNPWWSIFKQAIAAAGGKLAKLEILATTTNSRFFRRMGIPTLGFSPMKNTPILLHDHNEILKDSVY